MKLAFVAALAFGLAPVAANANLLINGNFEASTAPTTTPPGWTNIGHSDGVIPYSMFGTPAYDGDYYYDIGGFGGAMPAPGDGIEQSVATAIGSVYTLTFGYSSEGNQGQTYLDVLIGGNLTRYDMVPSVGFTLNKPFTTASINYVATSSSTLIQFIVSPDSASFGNNDPMIDGISFDLARAVPEPASWAMMIGGFALLGATLRRRKADVRFA